MTNKMKDPIKPIFFNTEDEIPKGVRKINTLPSALKELFFVENPHLKKSDADALKLANNFALKNDYKELWVYYPWLNLCVKIPSEDGYFKLRTARNRNLITEDEQVTYRNVKVGIAGLSVGYSILASLVSTGGPKMIKIADFDELEISNLNRIRATLPDIGTNKAHIAARKALELDPFIDFEIWDTGLDESSLNAFLLKPKLDIFIDEMDDIYLKAIARNICKENKIPVLMATDNVDGSILDVERFDLEPDRPIFHGNVPELEGRAPNKPLPDDWVRLFHLIVDTSLLPKRLIDSMQLIGKTLSGGPQLDTGASISGASVAYAVRQIAIGELLTSGKYSISLENEISRGSSSNAS
jgi:molybdopterin/thiamine biosynthesis adenylyltransferase